MATATTMLSCPGSPSPARPSLGPANTSAAPASLSTITRVWNDRLRASSASREATAVVEVDDALTVVTPAAKGSARLRPVLAATLSATRLGAASGEDEALTDTPAASTARSRGSASLCAVTTSSKRRTVVRFGEASRSASLTGPRRAVDPTSEDSVRLAKPLFPNTLLTEAQEDGRLLTLVLDLDETLVSNRDSRQSEAVLRPYCLHVLNALRHMKELEIVMWTASTKETASPVVEQLHQTGIIFDDIIFRNDIWFTQPIHTKDLRLLGRDMDRVLIVDNSVGCCKMHPRNSLLVEDFHGVRRRSDAALVNVYYVVDALLRMLRERAMTVPEGLRCLMAEGQLCHSVSYDLPEFFKCIPLIEVPELKRPPVGRFVRANTAPPNTSIMQHWVY